MRVICWLVSAALALSSMAADEPHQIYECTDPDGNTVYQDDPCATLAPAPAPAKPAAAPKAPQAPKAAAQPANVKKSSKSKPAPPPTPAQAPAPAIRFVVPKTGPPVIPSRKLPASNRPVDDRWETPDTTLKTFVAAVASGNRAGIVACMTASALADWGPEPEALPLDELRKTVAAFTGYVAEGDLGPYWSIRALRTGMRPKWIFFERNGDGEWKIGAL